MCPGQLQDSQKYVCLKGLTQRNETQTPKSACLFHDDTVFLNFHCFPPLILSLKQDIQNTLKKKKKDIAYSLAAFGCYMRK